MAVAKFLGNNSHWYVERTSSGLFDRDDKDFTLLLDLVITKYVSRYFSLCFHNVQSLLIMVYLMNIGWINVLESSGLFQKNEHKHNHSD